MGSCSTLRQGLPGDRQGPPWFLWSHSRTKYSSQGDKAPVRGACREGQPRHLKELAATRHASRQGPVSDKLPDATRQRPRQGACRGKLPLCTRALAHPPTCRPEPFQARVAGGCAASGARWHATLTRSPSWRTVASLTVLFCTVWATQTGIYCLCPLPSGLGMRHCTSSCTNHNPFSIFTLVYVATCW